MGVRKTSRVERGCVMPPIRKVVVKNLCRITLIMMAVILVLSVVLQVVNAYQAAQENARQIFSQVEQILDENTRELDQITEEYKNMCLNDARTVAYILEYNPAARDSVPDLRKIAANAQVDEIHIFNTAGVIVGGTHPEYYGLSFDSGEQMTFFKPMLADKNLELVQNVTPNTAEGWLVQYSALWSEDRTFIVQIGMYPSTLLRVTEKNSLSYIFSLLRTGVGYSLYAINPETLKIEGSTVVSDVGRDASELDFSREKLEKEGMFRAFPGGTSTHCISKRIGGNYVVWSAPSARFFRSVPPVTIMLLAGLALISLILVLSVAAAMNRTVIDPTNRVIVSLRAIQRGDLSTKVEVRDSREFEELSDHINGMVNSLLQSSEKLEMSEKIAAQKEELERQHEQLETALEQARKASKAKSEFLFNMSHDIRTPMNAVLGFTDLALESDDPGTQKQYLKNIDTASRQLLELIDNILELSRIENHKILVEEEPVDIHETVEKLSTIFAGDLKKKNLTYTVRSSFQHTCLYLDTTHFLRVLLNIVSNAIKYTPEGGSIEVSFTELPGAAPDTCVVETRVRDTGIGMSPEFLAQAFDSFSRERTSTVSGLQGTGLGLAIVKNLVEAMRGTVTIDSKQGVGTEVTVRLPHRLGEAPPNQRPQKEPAPVDEALFCGRRILLTEDIDINAMIAEKLLTGKGFLVERAKDGVECVDMLQKAPDGYYDLILMDIQMPVMDGYRTAETIRSFEDRKKAGIPILALTANAFQEDFERAMQAGMNGHVAKPLEASKLLRAIADFFNP